MTEYARNAYGTSAIPPDDTYANLTHDLQAHLRRNGMTPDERLIERILSRRGIGSERELVRSYGPDTPFAAFTTEYQSERCKAI